MRESAGFTLTELIVSLAAISVLAAVALPLLLSTRLAANEAAAISTLQDVAAGQAQFKASKCVDVDRDGVGEFGYFREMCGVTGVRIAADGAQVGDVIDPPALSRSFRALNERGEIVRDGYLFKLFLPGASGVGVGEMEYLSVEARVDSRLAAAAWGCYAWPTRYGTSGDRTYFTGASGVVVSVDSSNYSGSGRIGAANCGAALLGGTGPIDEIVGVPAVETTGRDGNVWRKAN